MRNSERVAYGSDPNQFIDFGRPEGENRRPSLVMIHGGFWRSRFDLSHSAAFCEALTHAGYPTANIEYRRVGQPGGGWPGTLEDARAATSFAIQRLSGPVVVMGHSAGGHLALWVAAQLPDLAGAVGLAPVASLRICFERNLSHGAVTDFLGGAPSDFPDRYAHADPAECPSHIPRLLIHGAADDIVPLELSAAYIAKRGRDPNPPRLVELPGADHFAVIDTRSHGWGVLMEFLCAFPG